MSDCKHVHVGSTLICHECGEKVFLTSSEIWKAKYAALQQVASAMAEALEAVEWVNDGPMIQYCPLCLKDRLDGHGEKCKIGISRTAFRTLEEKDK